jgi:hypothetical protein
MTNANRKNLGLYSCKHKFLFDQKYAKSGFFGSMVLSPRRFKKFMLLAMGDFLLWALLEDEFFFVFSGTIHTQTDWSTWFLGSIHVTGYYIPVWYFLAAISIFVFWYLGLTQSEATEPIRALDR